MSASTEERLESIESRMAIAETQRDRDVRRIKAIELRDLTIQKTLRRLTRSLLAALVAIALLGLFVVYLYLGRVSARQYYNNRIHDLVCAVPPVGDTAKQLRQTYKCGPYHTPATASSSPTPRPTGRTTARAGPAPAPTVPGPVRSTVPPRPSPTPSVGSPTPSVGRTVSRTATATVTAPAPSPSSSHGLLCVPHTALDPILVILLPSC